MSRPIVSLQQARELLPEITRQTADAVRPAESLAPQIQGVGEDDPVHAQLSEEKTYPWLIRSTGQRGFGFED